LSYSREILLNSFRHLFRKATGEDFSTIVSLKADSSERKIYRLALDNVSYIAVHNDQVEENIAYISFSESFHNAGLAVPGIIAVSDDSTSYLVEDLGDDTLFKITWILDTKSLDEFHTTALNDLIMFQTTGKTAIDFGKCFPSIAFDRSVISNDIEKFHKYFLPKISESGISDQTMMTVIDVLSEIAARNNRGYFMYRDFQPRNIMVINDELYYIDFQSGMKGASQYDLASFLYSGSINLDEKQRAVLAKVYCDAYTFQTGIAEDEFMEDFGEFVLLRLIQVLGSYSYVHHKKQKDDTLRKIPKALNNLSLVSQRIRIPVLKDFADQVLESGMKYYS